MVRVFLKTSTQGFYSQSCYITSSFFPDSVFSIFTSSARIPASINRRTVWRTEAQMCKAYSPTWLPQVSHQYRGQSHHSGDRVRCLHYSTFTETILGPCLSFTILHHCSCFSFCTEYFYIFAIHWIIHSLSPRSTNILSVNKSLLS